MLSFVRRTHVLWAILRGDPDAIVACCGFLLAGGIALMALSSFTNVPGILVGFFAATLGAAGGALEKWRSERGLWMLAMLFFLIYAFLYVCFCIGQVADALRGGPNDIYLMLEWSISIFFLVSTLRFLVMVAKENYVFSASSHGD